MIPDRLYKEPLDKICTYATSQAQDAIYWYFSKKEFRRCLCRILRITTILLVTIAGMLPIINEILGKNYAIHSLWSALALSVAAALILLDRFTVLLQGGFASCW